MKIAPEGLPFVFASCGLLLLLVVAWLTGPGWWLLVAGAWAPCALWIPWFFRDPDREGPRGDTLLIAPADGRVVSITEVHEPDFIAGPARRVSVFMNIFNVHVNRHPVTGIVRYRHHRPGRFVNATLDKASTDNEQMSLGIECARGRVLVRQIAGLIARRIVTDPVTGTPVSQGTRLGLIRFGSRVDTIVPPSTRVTVAVGERTQAGITVIAEWT